MKIGIVGAGLNSDYHIRFARAYPGADIIGIADTDLARAQDVARNNDIAGAFPSVEALLAAGPDVVHIVTPPRTHFSVVRQVVEAGRHVLVEKPLALNAAEAREMYALAERHGVQLCPMHNHLFDPCAQRAADAIASGALGRIINVESYYGLNTRIPAFRDYPRPNVLPWLYGLPGGIYQDFLPHPLYMLLEYTGACRGLSVVHRSNGVLPQGMADEIRILVDGEQAPGIVTVSFTAEPFLHFVRVYGTKMMLEIDINTMSTVLHPVGGLPKAAQKVTYNLSESWQQTRNTFSNVAAVLGGKLRPYEGMRTLIHAFYTSLEKNTAPPVTRDKALSVVETMDAVFEQLRPKALTHETIPAVGPDGGPARPTVLVTGGTGFLGRALVRALTGQGYAVRVLARKLANVDRIVALGAEVVWGDVADLESFDRAMQGIDYVFHLAAGTSGSERDSQLGTILGTRNLLDLCQRHATQKLIYVSSCSVYGVGSIDRGVPVTEDSMLEPHPELRGSYSASKQEAEALVLAARGSLATNVVVLRPGTIYGPGGDPYTPLMGFQIGNTYAVIRSRGYVLPFVHVENVVDAMLTCLHRPEANGQVYNVIDPEPLTKPRYMNDVIRRLNPSARVLPMPYALLYTITWFQELAFKAMKRRPVLTRYRLAASQRAVVYDGGKIMKHLGWTPPVRIQAALESLITGEVSGARVKTSLPDAALAQSAAR